MLVEEAPSDAENMAAFIASRCKASTATFTFSLIQEITSLEE
jgi:hypothetical protein